MSARNPAGMLTVAKLCIPRRSGGVYGGLPWGDCASGPDRHDGASGCIWVAPFFSQGNETLDSIGLYCSTLDAGKELKFMVYDFGTNGLPNNLFYTSSAISVGTTGFKQATGIGLATDARWYIAAHFSNSASSAKFELANNGYGWMPWGDIGDGTASYKSLYYDGTWPTPDDPFPVPTAYSTSAPFRYTLGFI